MADSRRKSRSSSSARGRCLCFLALVIGMLCGALPATGQTKPQSPTTTADDDPWRFNASLYGWMISVSGNVTARGQTVDTNASFIDLLQRSQSVSGVMGYFEADKGRVGMYLDLVYTNLGFDASGTNYRNPIAGLRITTTANTAMTYQLFVAEVGGIYEIARWQFSENSSTAIDLVGAFRYWNNSFTVGLDAAANVDFSRLHLERSFGLTVARENAIQWVDPVVGVRLRHQFTPRQQITLRGDIGGFGLGSQFSWQAVGVYSYSWTLDGGQHLAALLGFRALSVNYSSGSGPDAVGINETLYGPVIGVSYRF